MIDIPSLDLSTLPWLPLDARSAFPRQPVLKYFHATSPESCAAILRDGFEDRDDSMFKFGPGVWFGTIPAITGCGVDQCLGHLEETWIEVEMPVRVFDQYEILDPTWPCRQSKIPAAIVNQCPMREMSMQEVICLRRKNDPSFMDVLLSAVDSMGSNYCLINSPAMREWHVAEFGWVRTMEQIESSIKARERVLPILKAIADTLTTEEYERLIRPRVERLFSLGCKNPRCQCDE